MSDTLLSYFEQEILFIRDGAIRFSERHPGAARYLGIRKDSIDDPEVSRLIESVALLNARLQQRLDGTFPELTTGLLALLFPHFLRPVPSYTLLDFSISNKATAVHCIPAHTEFEIKDEEGGSAVFRSTKSVDLLPITIDSLDIVFAPFEQAKPLGAEKAVAMIALTIKTTNAGIDMSHFSLDHLPFHLSGDPHLVLRLLDLLFLNTSQMCVLVDGVRHHLGRDALHSCGFEDDDFLLPYQAQSFQGFKLLTEFLMFSERFHRFSVDFTSVSQYLNKDQFTLQFFVNELTLDLARLINKSLFSLFCVPLINLYPHTSEPIKIDFLKSQYPLTLDASTYRTFDLYCIDEVLDITQGERVFVPKIYSEKFEGAKTGLRWELVSNYEKGQITDHLKVVDLNHVSPELDARVFLLKTTVMNRFTGKPFPITSQIRCRAPLTIPAEMNLLRRPSLLVEKPDPDLSVWGLFCHLQFNYYAILGADDPCEALKSLLTAYNYTGNLRNKAYVDSLKKVEQEQVVAPIRISGKNCFSYGTKITITFSLDLFQAGQSLFALFLDRFFSYFVGFNSFIQLDVCFEGQDGVAISFPRRMGCKTHL